MNRRNRTGQSLEDAIRNVQQRYRNRPSPLAMMSMNENVHYIPTHVPDHMAASRDIRDTLLGSFRPPNDTFNTPRFL